MQQAAPTIYLHVHLYTYTPFSCLEEDAKERGMRHNNQLLRRLLREPPDELLHDPLLPSKTHTDTHRNTQTHRHTDTDTHKQTHTDTQTRTRTDTDSQIQA